MTPLEVKEQRRQEVVGQLDEMERQVNANMDLFDRENSCGQYWRKMNRSSSGTRKKES
jgi:hypothetical protein